MPLTALFADSTQPEKKISDRSVKIIQTTTKREIFIEKKIYQITVVYLKLTQCYYVNHYLNKTRKTNKIENRISI